MAGGHSRVGLPSSPVSITTDDFDNNKCPDLVGSSAGAIAEGPVAGSVWVLRGMPGGNFNLPEAYAAGVMPNDIATGDFDGDGFQDIVASNFGDDTVSVLINQTDGTFLPDPPLPVGAQPKAIDSGDYNGDSKRDITLVADDAMLGPSVQVLLNQRGDGLPLGGGTFGDPIAFGVDAEPNFVVTADMDGNGADDMITANTDGMGGSVTTLLNVIEPVTCLGDCAGDDGVVSILDFLAVLGEWGQVGSPCDIGGDGVGIDEFLLVIGAWGGCG